MQRRPVPRAMRAIRCILRPFVMLLTKRDWRGADKLPEGGFVLAANHVSHADPILLSHFMLDHGIAPRFLAKAGLMETRGLGWLLRSSGQISVRRDTVEAVEALNAAVDAVNAGDVVTIYPEGTITRDPLGWPMSGHTGAVRVALATGRPLIPVMQWGAQELLWPYTTRLRPFPRKTIHVWVGDPIDLSDIADQDVTESLLHETTDRLMDALTEMMIQLRGERPAAPRIDVRTVGRRKMNDKRQDE